MISYKPLYRTMKEKGETKYSLIYKRGINARTMQNIKDGKGISTFTLEKLCRILECTPNDIIEFTNAKSKQ